MHVLSFSCHFIIPPSNKLLALESYKRSSQQSTTQKECLSFDKGSSRACRWQAGSHGGRMGPNSNGSCCWMEAVEFTKTQIIRSHSIRKQRKAGIHSLFIPQTSLRVPPFNMISMPQKHYEYIISYICFHWKESQVLHITSRCLEVLLGCLTLGHR